MHQSISGFALLLLTAALAGDCGGGGGAGGESAPGKAPGGPALLQLETFQAATFVIGQANMKSQATLPPQADTLRAPSSVGPGSLWVADTGNDRVLRFATPVGADTPAADRVLGKSDFEGAGAFTIRATMSAPKGVSQDDGRLAVCDSGHHRVLLWNTIPTINGQSADVIVGAPETPLGPSALSLQYPTRCLLAGGRLLVSDSVRNRVLVWNQIPTADGTPADLVLGQPGFQLSTAGLGASGMYHPSGLWSDGVRLVVADTGNSRVLIWNTFPTTNGQPADLVLGQQGFKSGASLLGSTGMNEPQGVASNGAQLVVCDSSSNRVLVWNTMPSSNGQPADLILGQSSVKRGAWNDDDQDGSPGTTPSQRTFWNPTDAAIVGTQLLVCDYYNSRVLVFE